MRIIGHLPNEASAKTFSDYLYIEGISNVVEAESQSWAVWIHSDDEIPKARELLAGFLGNPQDPKYQKQARLAAARKEQEQKAEVETGRKFFDRSKIFRSAGGYEVGRLSVILIFGCVLVAVLSKVGANVDFLQAFFISKFEVTGGGLMKYSPSLPEISRGEIWRLFTPILIHFGFIHLFFNMLWLLDLGSMVEGRQGRWRFALLLAVISGVSNLAQYWVSGPSFGGMSGVVYGLLGYIWVKGKFDPTSGLFLHSQTAVMMLVWFFLCLAKIIPNVANTVHAAGLIVGLAWGFFSSLRANRALR